MTDQRTIIREQQARLKQAEALASTATEATRRAALGEAARTALLDAVRRFADGLAGELCALRLRTEALTSALGDLCAAVEAHYAAHTRWMRPPTTATARGVLAAAPPRGPRAATAWGHMMADLVETGAGAEIGAPVVGLVLPKDTARHVLYELLVAEPPDAVAAVAVGHTAELLTARIAGKDRTAAARTVTCEAVMLRAVRLLQRTAAARGWPVRFTVAVGPGGIGGDVYTLEVTDLPDGAAPMTWTDPEQVLVDGVAAVGIGAFVARLVETVERAVTARVPAPPLTAVTPGATSG